MDLDRDVEEVCHSPPVRDPAPVLKVVGDQDSDVEESQKSIAQKGVKRE